VSTTNFGKGCTAASSVLGDREEEHRAIQSKEEGGCGPVCSSSTGFAEGKEKGIEEGTATAALRMAGGEVAAGERSGTPWRMRRRTPGRGYDGDRRRGGTRGERGKGR
jgi:hypothetical protein